MGIMEVGGKKRMTTPTDFNPIRAQKIEAILKMIKGNMKLLHAVLDRDFTFFPDKVAQIRYEVIRAMLKDDVALKHTLRFYDDRNGGFPK